MPGGVMSFKLLDIVLPRKPLHCSCSWPAAAHMAGVVVELHADGMYLTELAVAPRKHVWWVAKERFDDFEVVAVLDATWAKAHMFACEEVP